MIHDWFMHFGGIAIVCFLVGLIPVKAYTKRHPPKGSDDKIGEAAGTLTLFAIAAALLVIAFLLVCFGISGTYVGWAGMLVLGVAFALLSTNN